MMSSVAGVVSSPKLGAYAASKFALEAHLHRAPRGGRGARRRASSSCGPARSTRRSARTPSTAQAEAGVRPPGSPRSRRPTTWPSSRCDAIDQRPRRRRDEHLRPRRSFASRVLPPVFRARGRGWRDCSDAYQNTNAPDLSARGARVVLRVVRLSCRRCRAHFEQLTTRCRGSRRSPWSFVGDRRGPSGWSVSYVRVGEAVRIRHDVPDAGCTPGRRACSRYWIMRAPIVVWTGASAR